MFSKDRSYHREFRNDPERCEYFVAIQWLRPVPLETFKQKLGKARLTDVRIYKHSLANRPRPLPAADQLKASGFIAAMLAGCRRLCCACVREKVFSPREVSREHPLSCDISRAGDQSVRSIAKIG